MAWDEQFWYQMEPLRRKFIADMSELKKDIHYRFDYENMQQLSKVMDQAAKSIDIAPGYPLDVFIADPSALAGDAIISVDKAVDLYRGCGGDSAGESAKQNIPRFGAFYEDCQAYFAALERWYTGTLLKDLFINIMNL